MSSARLSFVGLVCWFSFRLLLARRELIVLRGWKFVVFLDRNEALGLDVKWVGID